MRNQLSTDSAGVGQSAAALNLQAEALNDHNQDVSDSVAYEQVGLGEYWGTDDAPRQPVVFVGFPRNFRSRADHADSTRGSAGETLTVRYEQPLGESVPYEEMGLSRFL